MPITIGSENPLLTFGEGMGAFAGGYSEGLTAKGNYKAQAAMQAQQQQGQAFTGAYQTAYRQIGSMAERYQANQYQIRHDAQVHANAIDTLDHQMDNAASLGMYKEIGIMGRDVPAAALEAGMSVPDFINSQISKRRFAEQSAHLAAMGLEYRPPVVGEADFAEAQQLQAGLAEAQRNPDYSVGQLQDIRQKTVGKINALMTPKARPMRSSPQASWKQSSIQLSPTDFVASNGRGGWEHIKLEAPMLPGGGGGGDWHPPMAAPEGQSSADMSLNDRVTAVPHTDGKVLYALDDKGKPIFYDGLLKDETKRAADAAKQRSDTMKNWVDLRQSMSTKDEITGKVTYPTDAEVTAAFKAASAAIDTMNHPEQYGTGGGFAQGQGAGVVPQPAQERSPSQQSSQIQQVPMADGRIDASQLQSNVVYQINGKPYVWSGQVFVEVK